MKKDIFRYYTLEDLAKENKVACKNCDFTTDDMKCTLCYAVMAKPEDHYWTFEGNIIGCKHGEHKKPQGDSSR